MSRAHFLTHVPLREVDAQGSRPVVSIWQGREHFERPSGWRPVLAVGGQVVIPSAAIYRFTGADGAPNALVRFEIRKGRVECARVEVVPSRGGRAIRPSDFEGLKRLDQIGRDVFERLALSLVAHDSETGESTFQPLSASGRADLARELQRGLIDGKRSRKRPTPREELEDVARIYSRAERAPIAAVEAERGYSRRTAARRIAEARSLGLLEDAPTDDTESGTVEDDDADTERDARLRRLLEEATATLLADRQGE